MRDAPVEHHLDRVEYADLKTYLPGDILTKVDRASMATSLEVRVPMLDHELIEWAATLPPSFRLRGREGKYLLKKAMEKRLPDEILYRQKMGFSVPLADWFRGPLRARVQERLLGETLGDTGFFDTDFIKRMIDDHNSGIRNSSAAIWALLMFESFLRNVHAETSSGTQMESLGAAIGT